MSIEQRRTKLMRAVLFDVVDELLQDPRVDVNEQERHGATALMMAAAKGYEPVVVALLNLRRENNVHSINSGRNQLDVGRSTGRALTVREDHDDTPVGHPLDTGSGASTGGSVRAKAARRGVNHGANVVMRIRATRGAERKVYVRINRTRACSARAPIRSQDTAAQLLPS